MNQPTDQPATQSPPLRVALWCAVSSKPQAADDKSSLQDQEAAGRKFATALEAHVVRVYTVPGHTRDLIFWHDAEADMPAYRQLRQDVEDRAFDVLFALDPDRLGRDPALSNQVISLVEKSGAEVYLASAPHPVGHPTTGQRYLYAIQTVRSGEDQTRRIAAHRRGITYRVQRGLVACHWPLGYRPVRNAKGKTIGAEPDPDLAPAVLLTTRLFLAGETYAAIRIALNDSPYHPPKSRTWGYSTVWKILHNDTYAGFPHWNDVTLTEPSPLYPALWDPDTYAAILRERARRTTHRYEKGDGSPVAGIAFCRRCGHPMTRYLSHGRYYALRCSKHNQKSLTGRPCHYNYILESDVISALADFLQELAGPAALDHALSQIDDVAPLERDLAEVARHLEDLARRRERLALALAAGQMDLQIYRTTDDRLLADVTTLETERTHHQQLIAAAPDLDARRDALQSLAQMFPDLVAHAPAPRVRTLLQNAGLRIEIESGAITSIRLL